MISTDALHVLLNAQGHTVLEGEGTFRKPIVFEPARYPRASGPRGARVQVWLTSMCDTALLRVRIPLRDVVGPFESEKAAADLVYRNMEQPFGALKIRVLKAQGACIARGEVLYAAPLTSDDIGWFPLVLERLLSVWQESTSSLRELAERAERLHSMETGPSPKTRSSDVDADANTGAESDDEAEAPVVAESPAAEAQGANVEVKSEPIADLLAELDALVGMQPVKEAVRRLVATQDIARRRREIGLRTTAPSPHLVFTGNPGTGKTTVARMIGRLYRSMGMLSSGHVVEVGRSDLVGGYVGQTALKTKQVCESALGGVLFIDEAYSLRSNSGNDYGHEAVETLLTFMESHRGSLAVVVAGYPSEMRSFIDMNPGLASRFDLTLHFPDYSNAELASMLRRMFLAHDYRVRDSQVALWENLFARLPRERGFGNAREVRRIFDEICAEQAVRLTEKGVSGHHDLRSISPLVMSKVSQRYPWPAKKGTTVRELNLGYL